MSDMPKHVHIKEVGPREGFQIEEGPIATADKVRFMPLAWDKHSRVSRGRVGDVPARRNARRAGRTRRR